MEKYTLKMLVRENGEIKKITHTRNSEQECDDAQLQELPRLEAIGAELISARILRERTR